MNITVTKFSNSLAVILFAAMLGFGSTARSAESDYNLGVRAFQRQDFASARQYWEKARKDEVRAAYNNLGYLLYYGKGGPADPDRAVALWTVAAQHGDRESQWHLAIAFEEGKGVNTDLLSAYAWFRCAAANFAESPLDEADEQALAHAREAVSRLLAQLSLGELGEAEQRARLYIKKYPGSSEQIVVAEPSR